MMSLPLLWAGAASAMAAILLLRFAWARPQRSVPLNAAAWGLLLVGVLLGALDAGAWGMAIVSVVAMAAASLCLAYAGLMSPPGRAVASNRRVNMLPERNEPMQLGARFLTFALTVPGALVATFLAALGVRALAGRAGMGEADSNVLMLYLMPLLWAVIATVQLMWPRRRMQALLVVVPALAGLLLRVSAGHGA